MLYYFLERDWMELNDRIRSVNKKVEDAGKDVGESCSQGAETFHDNAPYEEAVRAMQLNSSRLRELVNIQQEAEVIPYPSNPNKVVIGSVVKVLDMDTDDLEVFQIGSYIAFFPKQISYTSPLAKLLLGVPKYHSKRGKVGDRERELLVLDIMESEDKHSEE